MSFRTHLSSLADLASFSFLALLFSAIPVAAQCVSPPPGLQGWWTMDDSAFSSSAENLASGLDGTFQGTIYEYSGRVSHARHFGGNNDHVLVADHAAIDIGSDDLTIDAWIRTTGDTGVRTIIDKRTSAWPHTGYHLFLWNGRLALQLADSSGWENFYADSSTPDVADGVWHFVAVTVDRNSPTGVRFFVDGAHVGAALNPTARYRSLANSEPLTIGRRHDSAINSSWHGEIDELEIFNRALSYAELDAIYGAGPVGKCKGFCPTLSMDLTCNPHPNLTEYDCFANETGGCAPYNINWSWTGGGIDSDAGGSFSIVLCDQSGVVSVTVTDQDGSSVSDSKVLQCSSGGCTGPFCLN